MAASRAREAGRWSTNQSPGRCLLHTSPTSPGVQELASKLSAQPADQLSLLHQAAEVYMEASSLAGGRHAAALCEDLQSLLVPPAAAPSLAGRRACCACVAVRVCAGWLAPACTLHSAAVDVQHSRCGAAADPLPYVPVTPSCLWAVHWAVALTDIARLVRAQQTEEAYE